VAHTTGANGKTAAPMDRRSRHAVQTGAVGTIVHMPHEWTSLVKG
jgi:hypothetical protein